MMRDSRRFDDCSGAIVDCAMRVHTFLGPGLLESAYEACLALELRERGLLARRQVPLPIIYHHQTIDVGYRVDMIVDDQVLVELKAVTRILPVHYAHMLSYLRLSGLRAGLLINFHEPRLKDGIKRMVNGY
jgi:GxxExxY protein